MVVDEDENHRCLGAIEDRTLAFNFLPHLKSLNARGGRWTQNRKMAKCKGIEKEGRKGGKEGILTLYCLRRCHERTLRGERL